MLSDLNNLRNYKLQEIGKRNLIGNLPLKCV